MKDMGSERFHAKDHDDHEPRDEDWIPEWQNHFEENPIGNEHTLPLEAVLLRTVPVSS
jgi:hypothetical protein